MRVILFAVLAAACGDDLASAPDAAMSSDAAPPCAPGAISWSFTVRDTDFSGALLAGATVCLVDPLGPCLETPTSGRVDFCVQANSQFAMTTRLEGYMPLLAPLVAGDAEPTQPRANTIPIARTTQSCSTWQSAGVACPPTTQGLVWMKAVRDQPSVPAIPDPLGDVSIASADALDVFYGNPQKDAALTATDADWGNAYAVYGGDTSATITATRPNQQCRAFSFDAWPGANVGEVAVPVRAGFRTFVMVTCE